MYDFSIDKRLRKKLIKLPQKNKFMFECLIKKIDDIINSDLNHYKNLRNPLKEFKRVHINKSFVLIFKLENNKIIFYDLDHHDNIYKFAR